MVIIYDSDKNKKPTESELEYVQRMCATKETNQLTWKGLTELLNDTLGYSFSESYYRKHFNSGDFATTPEYETTSSSGTIETTYTTSCDNSDCVGDCSSCGDLPVCLGAWKEELDASEEKLDNKLLEMRKERVKLNDERAENNRLVRKLAREETLIEIAREYAKTMNEKNRLPIPFVSCTKPSGKEGILLLSDWHYGMVCDNPWNKFDPKICTERIGKLLNKVMKIVREQQIAKVTVLNLSDLIAGRIHSQIRIESRFDVITQTMNVSEILAEFLSTLSTLCEIDYYDCLDNHSRVEPNKAESLDLESMVRIIPWFLNERLAENTRVHIMPNEFGPDIITCNILGHDIIAVHGDQDSPVTGIDKLTLFTRRNYDMFCTAHRHHFFSEEKNQCVVVGNSSLIGTDSYAERLRLSADPSQTFIIATEDNVCECIYRIKLV